tara:strand:+ start:3469 stop:3711 length:243 start_codon:yes stop_codon:yes gene_type:complete
MEVKYSFRMEASCPVDNMGDLYDVVITSDKPIPVEDIMLALETVRRKQFQETLTEDLAREIPARVTTVGWHSGIKVVCKS